MTAHIDSPTLKAWLSDGRELALLDVREHGQFGEGHLFFAVPLPYSRFELGLPALAAEPGRAARAVRWRQRRCRARSRAGRGTGLPQRPHPRGRRAGVATRRLHALCRRQCAEQDLRRARRAREAHAPGDGAGRPGHARRRREFRHRRRPPARRIRQDEHPRRHLLPERRAGAAHPRHRPRPEDQDRRQLRRPHALHHRRADADRFRGPQSGLRAGERHAGVVPRRPRARARGEPALWRQGRRRRPCRRARGARAQARRRTRGGIRCCRRGQRVARGHLAHDLPPRCAHAGGVCGARRTGVRARAGRPADPGDGPVGGRQGRAAGAGRRGGACARRWWRLGCASSATRPMCSKAELPPPANSPGGAPQVRRLRPLYERWLRASWRRL